MNYSMRLMPRKAEECKAKCCRSADEGVRAPDLSRFDSNGKSDKNDKTIGY